mgnify:CR=1 FL=1|tara:strand:+ start:1502 stop:1987 length:486 start_codon:yes stop_codon:yes gene_type:complete
MIEKWNFDKKIFLSGIFEGKYKASVYSSIGDACFSNIVLLEGKLSKVEKYDYQNLFSISKDMLFNAKSFELEFYLDDEAVKDKYIFKEDIKNALVYNVELSEQLREGDQTFGVIKGSLICYLDDEDERDMLFEENYVVSKKINFSTSSYKSLLNGKKVIKS